MRPDNRAHMGHACAYTPLPLLHAAGYTPYRVLPTGDAPDRAGQILHDNLCPHVKRILDRALQGDLPELEGMIFMNCCDPMRRLADGWRTVRPADHVMLVDLPVTADHRAVSFFADEISRLRGALSDWTGRRVTDDAIEASTKLYNRLDEMVTQVTDKVRRQVLESNGDGVRVQDLFNRAATEPVERVLEDLRTLAALPEADPRTQQGVPVFLFGNVLPDAAAFDLFQACGVRIVVEDLCTSSRSLTPILAESRGQGIQRLAEALLSRPKCARTFDPAQPGKMSDEILNRARDCGAKGVIGYTMKFCDPYMARLHSVRRTLREAGLPLLLLEGDCTMRSIGQQRTRIEAFAEMMR